MGKPTKEAQSMAGRLFIAKNYVYLHANKFVTKKIARGYYFFFLVSLKKYFSKSFADFSTDFHK
jgi:hypothetical protein